MEKETTVERTIQPEISASRQREDLLATETGFQKERLAYQPGLCPALAGGGVTRPLDGGGLEVLKVAREREERRRAPAGIRGGGEVVKGLRLRFCYSRYQKRTASEIVLAFSLKAEPVRHLRLDTGGSK